MKMYLADSSMSNHRDAATNLLPPDTVRILISFHYFGRENLEKTLSWREGKQVDIFADSGAFSAHTQGADIDLPKYIEWLKRWTDYFSVYANLDVIGQPGRTLANQKTMEDAGLLPLPVFHTGSPWQQLDYYLEHYRYIGLGGMVPWAKYPQRLMPWLIECFQRAKGRAVFHGFGMTSWTNICSLPWYSVDSTTWSIGVRFGRLPLFCKLRRKFVSVYLGSHEESYREAKLLREYDIDPASVVSRKLTRAQNCALAGRSYKRAEAFLRERHGMIALPTWTDKPCVARVEDGLKLQLACVSEKDFELLGLSGGDENA